MVPPVDPVSSRDLPTKDCAYVHRCNEDLLARLRQLEQDGSRAAMLEISRIDQELKDYIDRNDSDIADCKTMSRTAQQVSMKAHAEYMEARLNIERGIDNLGKKQLELKGAFAVAETAAVDSKAYIQLFDADTWPKYKQEVLDRMHKSRFTRGELLTMVGLMVTIILALGGALNWFVRQNNSWLLSQMETKLLRLENKMESGQSSLQRIIEEHIRSENSRANITPHKKDERLASKKETRRNN